ncbi:MAG: acetyl-CoA carboxylase biotin carboxyl carrier protein [Legionellales bacterium]|nr:acetyl-CoA carboxylase biotin carboxyl carrier protein [Legionellales bacterium]
MDIRKVKKLIDLIEESGIAEIEIKEGEESVRISRVSSVASPVPMMMAQPAQATHHQVEVQQITPKTTDAKVANKTHEEEGQAITSPMVGTVYLSPSPEADPFVKVGQQIAPGTVLCLIEAMKMFNQIEADRAGVIKKCLVESGTPVEFGQPLFIIE